MKKILSIVGAVLISAPAFAQVRVEIPIPTPRVVVPPPAVQVRTPSIHFGAPPQLVEVQPGVSVVRDFDQEVFFADGWYWHPGPSGWWYRARDYRSGWEPVQVHVVPQALVRLPRGHYVRYHGPAYWERQRDWRYRRDIARQDRAYQWQRQRQFEREQAEIRARERAERRERQARERQERRREWRRDVYQR